MKLKGFKVKLSYSDEFFFENIDEAAIFFSQALNHGLDKYEYAAIIPVYRDTDVAEEVSDD